MRKIPVEKAVGEVLCHDMTAILADGFKGVKFHRGHVITPEDVPELLKIGKTHIYLWEPEEGDVHEDEAAGRACKAICGENLILKGPTEGKIGVSSAIDGLFCLNREALKQFNALPDYTAATVRGFIPVKAGQPLAGVRIVPLLTKEETVKKAEAIGASFGPILSVKPFLPVKTGIIITGSEIYNGLIKDAFEPILRSKLAFYGAEVLGVQKCPDDLSFITNAIEAFIAQGARLLLLTGGMSVDPDDLTPGAIRRCSDTLVTQGVPMQPGNMLTIAYKGDTALIGVPGASMHSPVTSLEVFLPRILAGIKITPEEISGYGEGGLCMGCRECRWPVCPFGCF